MKVFILFLGFLFFSCGSEQSIDSGSDGLGSEFCSHAAIGTWMGSSDSVYFSSTASFYYSGADGCISSGSFICPNNSSHGTLNIYISSSSGGFCFPKGSYSCTYSIDDNKLTYNCGAGNATYTKQ